MDGVAVTSFLEWEQETRIRANVNVRVDKRTDAVDKEKYFI